MDKTIYILGVGHNTIVTIELAEACGYTVGGLYHYQEGRTGDDYFGHTIIGTTGDLLSGDLTGKCFALSMGDNLIRAELFKKIRERGGQVPALIHPTASFSRYSSCEDGVQVLQFAVVDPDVTIGTDTVVSAKSIVHHSSRLGAHCFIAADVIVGAYTTIEDSAFIGSNATLVSGKARLIGHHATIGAASVVTRPVEANSVVFGIPARKRDEQIQKP